MVRRIINRLSNGYRLYKHKKMYGSIFGKRVYIDKDTIIEGYINIERQTKIYKCFIGQGTDIASENEWTGCKIGKYSVIGAKCRNITGHHPTSFFVAMNSKFYKPQKKFGFVSEYIYKDEYKFADKEKRYYNIIGNDVYLTDSVTILEGVKIGNGAVVTPGSVVTKNVPPYAIVRGNPAKVETYRFSPEIIVFLEDLKWWDKDEQWIKDHIKYFSDVKKLKAQVESELKET